MGLISGRPVTDGARAIDTLARQQRDPMFGIGSAADLIPQRINTGAGGRVQVTPDNALRHSAVWAALRLRADLISTFPLDVFRRVGDMQVACPVPPVLANPSGEAPARGGTGMCEWLYSTQMDLDRYGNAFGLIMAVDGLGFPAVIELYPASCVSVITRAGSVYKYRINGTLYDPAQVWHERAHTVSGLQVGLSPLAYAAWSIGEYLTVQQFATNYFGTGAVPRARLGNTAKKVGQPEAATIKESWRASISANEPFVHGSDWEYEMITAPEASADWIEAKKFSIADIARFFSVPADLIDSAPTGVGRTMTYANISQRNIQLLTMNLGPAIIRREAALTGITPNPRFVRFNTDALLRLDPLARAQAMSTQIESRTLTVTEARALDNRPPLAEADIELFLRLFGTPSGSVPGGTGAGTAPPSGDQAEIEPGDTTPALGAGS